MTRFRLHRGVLVDRFEDGCRSIVVVMLRSLPISVEYGVDCSCGCPYTKVTCQGLVEQETELAQEKNKGSTQEEMTPSISHYYEDRLIHNC